MVRLSLRVHTDHPSSFLDRSLEVHGQASLSASHPSRGATDPGTPVGTRRGPGRVGCGAPAGIRAGGGDCTADRRSAILALIYCVAHRHILPVQFLYRSPADREVWAYPELSVTDDEPPLWDMCRSSSTGMIGVLRGRFAEVDGGRRKKCTRGW